jgi:hypothetical protein
MFLREDDDLAHAVDIDGDRRPVSRPVTVPVPFDRAGVDVVGVQRSPVVATDVEIIRPRSTSGDIAVW